MNKTLKAAEEMGIKPRMALIWRISYVREQINNLLDSATFFMEHEADYNNEFISLHWAKEDLKEVRKLLGKLKVLSEKVKDLSKEPDITDFMVETARAYPMDKLVEFQKNKALCPAHEDKTPSLYYDKKRNRAHCFACDKSWNPIDWLIEFDGMSFKEAVKQLNSL